MEFRRLLHPGNTALKISWLIKRFPSPSSKLKTNNHKNKVQILHITNQTINSVKVKYYLMLWVQNMLVPWMMVGTFQVQVPIKQFKSEINLKVTNQV